MKKKTKKIAILFSILVILITGFLLIDNSSKKSSVFHSNSTKENSDHKEDKEQTEDYNIENNNDEKNVENGTNEDKIDNYKNSTQVDNNDHSDSDSNKNNNSNNTNITQNSDTKNNSNVSNSSNNNNDNSSLNTSDSPVANNKATVISATKEYYCDNGYSLNGMKCTKTISNQALTRYVCSSGTLDGTKCISTSNVVFTTFTSSAKELCANLYGSGSYTSCLCSKSGGTMGNENKCYKQTTVSTTATLQYYCPSDYALSGTNCIKTYETNALFKYTCPSEYSLVGTNCIK